LRFSTSRYLVFAGVALEELPGELVGGAAFRTVADDDGCGSVFFNELRERRR